MLSRPVHGTFEARAQESLTMPSCPMQKYRSTPLNSLREAKWRKLVVVQSAFEAHPLSLSAPAAEKVNVFLSLPAQKTQQVARFLVENERLFVVAASTMIMSISHTALRPVLPVFAKGFGVGAAAVGTTISVYAIARLMMNLPAGMLADEKGRKPLLVWGPAITAIGMLGCGFASSFRLLLFWRWVTGLGSALQMAGAQLFLSDISKSNNRARTLGTNQAASLIGGLLGPAVGGVLADTMGIRAPFTFTGIAAGVAALYGLIRLPETHQKRESARSSQQNNIVRKRTLANPIMATTPLNSNQLSKDVSGLEDRRQSSLNATSSSPESSSSVQPASRLSQRKQLTQMPLPQRMTRRSRQAWRQLLGNRNFRAIALINAVMFATANGSRSVLMPLLAVQGYQMKTTFLGLIFAGMAIVSLVGVMPAAYVADHLGRKWTIVPSSFGLAAGLLLMATTGRVEGFLMAAGVWAVSNACIGATPAAYAADVMPKSVSGLGLGIYRSAGDLGLMVGPALLGYISDISSVQTAMIANAAVLVIAVAIFGLTAQETRQTQPDSN